MNIVFSLDGVLRGGAGDLVTDGLLLYRSMKVLGRVVLITEMDRPLAEVWCMMHNLGDYDDLLDPSVLVDPAENVKYRQIAVARSRGPITMYVDADPTVVAEALRMGITSLLFSSPQYSRPEFRPDAPKEIRRWDDIVSERTRQQAMKAVDARFSNQDDLVNFE